MLTYNASFNVLLNAVDNIRNELDIKIADYPINIWEKVNYYPYLEIIEESFISDGLCGFLIRNSKPIPSIIVINSNISDRDKNFAICHEIIHYFCHPIEHEDKFFAAYNKYTQTAQEMQANEGAAELLIPKEIFITEIHNAREFYKDEDIAVQNTARLYNVAPEVIYRRIKKLSK